MRLVNLKPLHLALFAVAALLALPGSATAATTLGDPLTDASTLTVTCTPAPCTIAGSAPAEQWTVSRDSVITGWGVRDADGEFQIVALRPAAGGFQVAARGQTFSLTGAGGPSTTSGQRIPVKAGDRVAIELRSATAEIGTTARAGWTYDRFQPAPSESVPGTPSSTAANRSPLYNVTLEPDADGDGFGDETQDRCPTEPTPRGGPCATDLAVTASGSAQFVGVGDTLTNTFVARNDGPRAAEQVYVTDVLPEGAEYVSTSCGIPGERSIHCNVGTLQAGQSFTMTIVLRALRPGSLEHRGDVFALEAPDPNMANNVATVQTTVNAPPPPPRTCGTTLRGDGRVNTLAGTVASETIQGLGGNDLLRGGDAIDCVFGGPGNDRIAGGGGDDRLSGGTGNDRVAGDAGNDRLKGDSGNDRLAGGADTDSFDGGAGNDTIAAADKTRETIKCGKGRDTVTADRTDRVARDCERVKRRR